MNNKQNESSVKQILRKSIFPSTRASVSSVVAGLVFCSVAVVAETTQQGAPTYTLKIITHGEGANRSNNLDENSRQDNRRTDVSIKTQVPNGYKEIKTVKTETSQVQTQKAVNRSIRLKDGGVVWVTKDPAELVPKLNAIASSSVEIEGGVFSQPVSFKITSNYSHFIDSWELVIYDNDDEQRSNALATFTGSDLATDQTVTWDGTVEGGGTLASGDNLVYVLTAKSAQGHSDETYERNIAVIGPDKNISESVDTDSNALENNLKRQTIPVHGSTVRVSGRDIATGHRVTINDNAMTLSDNKFVTEAILPEGQHTFSVDITDSANQTYSKDLNVQLSGKYLFMVGLADVTIGEGRVSENLETLSDGDQYLDGDIFVDGRLAFYLKGKVKGKYLITAQMDTGTAPIEDIFDDIHKKDPESIFRRLDPDEYYPVYGDDSTIIDDTDSQGKLYVRVDWDKSRAIWGNYNTDFTGTELSSFNRSLYGAKLDYRSTQVTSEGEHKANITLFGSEAQSALRHNEFLGTGGSLYYLNDSDIVNGSEKVWIEVRESTDSDRAIETIVLEEGRDYQIDDFQGRIILNRPLLQIAQQANPSLIKDDPLDGNQVYLMVDYEYVPDDFDADKASLGARGKVWLGDHFAVGGTYVFENRVDDDYEHIGVDVTIQKAKGTYLKGEYAESESNQTLGSFFSSDGGLNFDAFSNDVSAIGSDTSGSAYSIEGRVSLNEYVEREGSIGAWYKLREAGFSSSNYDHTVDTIDAGITAIAEITDKFNASLRATLIDEDDISTDTTISLQGDYKASDRLVLSAEVRHVNEEDHVTANNDGEGTLGAFKVGYDVNNDVNLYAIAQGTIERSGTYESNDLLTLGAIAKINNKVDLNAEVSAGDRGDSAVIGLQYSVSDDYDVYTNYTLSTDGTEEQRNIFTVGQRKTVSDQLKVYTEHQFTHEDTQAGLGHTFGLDYKLTKQLNANLSYQRANLEENAGGLIDRDAISVGLNYKKDQTQASTKLEYRRDKSSTEETIQWVTTNQFNHRISPSLRIQGRLNHSETNDERGDELDARFTEAGLGFAYRPVDHDRHNILGRITYLYDLQPIDQTGAATTDERSLIASLENNYEINQRWEVGGRVAHKFSEIRIDRDAGEWVDNDATLAAVRLRYHFTHNWDGLAQYHWLNSDESGDTEHGAMISIDRHIGKNMKIGIGYNFTSFDDDLSDLDGDAQGWFINLVGKF